MLIGLSLSVVIFGISGEVLARFSSSVMANGMPVVKVLGENVPLLPFRPDATVVDEWERVYLESRFVVPDPDLGWCVAPSSDFEVPMGRGKTVTYRSNSQGFRSDLDEPVAARAEEGIRRVIVVGDSFTFGSDVSVEASWPAQLEQSREDLEVINLGVPSYGNDQAFLRWRRDGKQLNGDVVILGIWPEDICRCLNILRYFFSPSSGYLMVKPRFRLRGEELELLGQPVPELEAIRHALVTDTGNSEDSAEFWLDPTERDWSPLYASRLLRAAKSITKVNARRSQRQRLYDGSDPTAYDLTLAIALEFQAEVEAAGGRFLVAILPQRELIGEFPGTGEFPLSERMRSAGLDVVDSFPSFQNAPAGERLFLPTDHFNRRGHALVAQDIGAWLNQD